MQIHLIFKSGLIRLLVINLILFNFSVNQLQAQNTEAGSVTSDSKTLTDSDSDLDHANQDSEEKKDERPRELGVMLIIVWLILGTGVGILIFTSLFGHSVRSMVRRPYPTQSDSEQQSSLNPASNENDESNPIEDESKL
ncbi:hypothetical protein [Gimesia aquarii]|uniref:Uncharacterized protein n=1 Tax=Gimesia aquarii TaxID=2527964 RepID=A0A517WYJ5_9PLAN|nr:hypothetical protein [Gimesia aquarii]QDU10321.1 hypothetical protein V202x_37200 [Gimesia aquarii]